MSNVMKYRYAAFLVIILLVLIGLSVIASRPSHVQHNHGDHVAAGAVAEPNHGDHVAAGAVAEPNHGDHVAAGAVAEPNHGNHDSNEKKILYWMAPMDPHYRRDEPGKSPMGMDLIPIYSANRTGSLVTILPEVVQNLGIRTAKVARTSLWQSINTIGYVDYDEEKVSHIHLKVSGWIEQLGANSEGKRFAKGDMLLELYSPELVNAQQEYLQSLASGNEYLIEASSERLSALGLVDEQIHALRQTRKAQRLVPIIAEHDGVVAKLSVRHGMHVTPANQVMSLVDLSSIWIRVEVFEKQAAWVQVGNPAEVSVSYLPGEIWRGKVAYIYPSLNPKTRALMVRLRFDNPDEKLKPNMFAKVKIFSGVKENVLVVPTEALIRTGGEDRVIVSNGQGGFEPKVVVAGIESGHSIEILSGIHEGENVVVSGQFLIDSEASLRASMMRMESVESAPMSGDGK